jgi:hypothetical protein
MAQKSKSRQIVTILFVDTDRVCPPRMYPVSFRQCLGGNERNFATCRGEASATASSPRASPGNRKGAWAVTTVPGMTLNTCVTNSPSLCTTCAGRGMISIEFFLREKITGKAQRAQRKQKRTYGTSYTRIWQRWHLRNANTLRWRSADAIAVAFLCQAAPSASPALGCMLPRIPYLDADAQNFTA